MRRSRSEIERETRKRGIFSVSKIPDNAPRGPKPNKITSAFPRFSFHLFIALLCLGACRKAPPVERGDAGAAMRVVSLSPSTTETLFVIGAGDKVVGRSRYCDWPPEVLKLPQIGGYVDPSFEAILALRPDLVTGARGPAGAAMSERLEARGIATFLPQTESFAQIDEMILGLGERTGRAAEAKKTVAALDAHVAAIEKAVADRPRVRVLLVFGLEPLSVAGPASFAEEMIRRAGGTNVITEGGGYPMIGVERVMTLDPDVVVNAAIAEAHGKERIGKDTPGWGRVRAVVDGRIAPISDESVLRPGPRIGDGLATLARAIHPEVTIP
jgi:iron complex transport system substrate-binding protein